MGSPSSDFQGYHAPKSITAPRLRSSGMTLKRHTLKSPIIACTRKCLTFCQSHSQNCVSFCTPKRPFARWLRMCSTMTWCSLPRKPTLWSRTTFTTMLREYALALRLPAQLRRRYAPSQWRSQSSSSKVLPLSCRTPTRTLHSSFPRRVRYWYPWRQLKPGWCPSAAAEAATAAGGARKTSSDFCWHSANPMTMAGCFFKTLSKCSRICTLLGRLPQFPKSHPVLPMWAASLSAVDLLVTGGVCLGAVSL